MNPKESFRPRPGIFPRKVDLDAAAFKSWKEVWIGFQVFEWRVDLWII